MKIAFLSRYQNTINRGAEVFVKELSQRLSKNHQVDILSGKESDSLRKILKGKYNIVFAMNGGLQAFKAAFGRLLGHYKLIIVGEAGIGKVIIWNVAVCQPDVFVALTDYMVSWTNVWAWRSRVIKIPNGVDLTKFRPQGEKIDLRLEKPIILSVGALSWYKHHQKVIKAFSYINKGSLLIVGDGEERKKLEDLGKNILKNRFKILSIPYQEMPKVYRSVDLFTLPSWGREAFGIVYLEAMASGLGVVAPDDWMRREIVSDAGLFVNVDNPKEYSEVIKKALNISWVEQSRKQAEKFSWEKVARQYEDLFETLLKGV